MLIISVNDLTIREREREMFPYSKWNWNIFTWFQRMMLGQICKRKHVLHGVNFSSPHSYAPCPIHWPLFTKSFGSTTFVMTISTTVSSNPKWTIRHHYHSNWGYNRSLLKQLPLIACVCITAPIQNNMQVIDLFVP